MCLMYIISFPGLSDMGSLTGPILPFRKLSLGGYLNCPRWQSYGKTGIQNKLDDSRATLWASVWHCSPPHPWFLGGS